MYCESKFIDTTGHAGWHGAPSGQKKNKNNTIRTDEPSPGILALILLLLLLRDRPAHIPWSVGEHKGLTKLPRYPKVKGVCIMLLCKCEPVHTCHPKYGEKDVEEVECGAAGPGPERNATRARHTRDAAPAASAAHSPLPLP
eukprot:1961124-Prymnesium_polylepis.1